MSRLPEAVKDTWEKRSGPDIFATVSDESMPNAIYVTCVGLYDDGTVVIADDYFDKTGRNILAGSRGSFLFVTDDHKTYQIKGTISRHTSGPVFDHMKSWYPEKHPGHAAAALSVEEVYRGAEKLL
jgi:predicted pyridoxine 5'-phosphate oxidase superfamily flavin-nucleotide-binding protein